MGNNTENMIDELAKLIQEHMKAAKAESYIHGYRVGYMHGEGADDPDWNSEDYGERLQKARETGEKMWKYLESIPAQEDIRKTLRRILGVEA